MLRLAHSAGRQPRGNSIVVHGWKRAKPASCTTPHTLSCVLRVDEKVFQASSLLSEMILRHELRNLSSAAKRLETLKLIRIRPSEAVIGIIRDALVQFIENTGKPVHVSMRHMHKVQPPSIKRVTKSKQDYEQAQQRMASGFT